MSRPYNQKILREYKNIQHAGEFTDTVGVITARAGSKSAGEVMQLQLKVEADKITDVKFKVYGCGYAIACLSYTANFLYGNSMSNVKSLNSEVLIDSLKLPLHKYHCAYLVDDLLAEFSLV